MNIFLDTCAFDPKDSLEEVCAKRIMMLYEDEKIVLILSHTNQKEIDHPRTPADVKRKAAEMIYTLEVGLNIDEIKRLAAVNDILRGNANPTSHYSDATHIFQSIKYAGCFITVDNRILNKRSELKALGATILKPSEWLASNS